MEKQVATYGIIFMIAYFCGLIVLAYYGYKKTKTFSDFTTAAKTYGPPIAALVAVSTAASAITYMGIPGMAYKFGYSVLWFPAMWPAALALAFAISGYGILQVQERLGSLSIPDYFGDRFNSEVLRVIAACLTIMVFWWVLGNFVAVGWLFKTIFGLTYSSGLILCAVIVVAYVFIGGTFADVLTDTVQSIIMIAVSVITLFIAFLTLFPGGVSELNAKLIAQDPLLGWNHLSNPAVAMVGSPWKIAMMFCALFFIGVTSVHAKYLLVLKDKRQLRQFCILYFIFGYMMGIAVFGGLGARAYLGAGITPDKALPTLYVQAFHPILGACLAVALLAGIMSTTDGVFLTISVAVSNEIYRKTIAKYWTKVSDEVAEKKAFLISRITLIVLGAAAMYFASPPPKFLVILVWSGFGVLIVAVAPAIIVSGFWRKTTKAGAWASVIVGIVVYFILIKIKGWGGVFEAIGIATLCATAATILVSLFTKPLPQDLLEKMFGKETE